MNGNMTAAITRRRLLGTGCAAVAALADPAFAQPRPAPPPHRRLPGWVMPEDFGAKGDGEADDTAAVTEALRSGRAVALAGLYRLTAPVLFGDRFNENPVMIQGMGRTHFLIDHAGGDALHFDGGTLETMSGNALTAKDFTMVCAAPGFAGSALKLSATGGSGSVYKSLDITNVITEAATPDVGFRTGIHLVNQRHGVVRGCIHNGVRNVRHGERQGSGVFAEGDGDPVDFTVENCQAYFTGRGVHIAGTHEGITIDKHSAVACDEGVHIASDENPVSGPNAGKPLFWITNSHFHTHRFGVYIDRARDFIVTGNDMLAEQPDSDWRGLTATVADAASQYGWIEGNKFQDAFGDSAGTTVGISLDGHERGVLDTRIGVNRYVGLRIGLLLGESARRVLYSGASLYAAVERPVVDRGSENESY